MARLKFPPKSIKIHNYIADIHFKIKKIPGVYLNIPSLSSFTSATTTTPHPHPPLILIISHIIFTIASLPFLSPLKKC